MGHIYDMIILGGGPGGYTAALYATRGGLDTLVLEKLSAGGQMLQTTQIDNYPGFDQGIDGYTLGEKMRAGAERFGAKTLFAEVTAVHLDGDVKQIETDQGSLQAKTVVIATGAAHRHLGVAREEALVGRGVAYCAACDGMFYKGKTVAVVGGGNSAVADALLLSRIAKRVFLIHRRDTLRAARVYDNSLKNAHNIEFRWNTAVQELIGEEALSGLQLQDVNTGETAQLPVEGVFISIGQTPETTLFEGQLERDGSGYLVADESTKTKLAGVFAVGDVRTKPLRQIITATADGAVAAHYAEEYLTEIGK